MCSCQLLAAPLSSKTWQLSSDARAADGKYLVGDYRGLQIQRAATCKILGEFEDVCVESRASFHWSPDGCSLLVVTDSYDTAHGKKLSLIDLQPKEKKLLSSGGPLGPLRAVLGWGQSREGPVLLCAGEAAAGMDNCPVQCMTLQGSSWSALGQPIAGAAVFVSRGTALAALSPSAKHMALISTASVSSAWSVQVLDIAAASVVAEWAGPAASGPASQADDDVDEPARPFSLVWAQSGRRIACHTSTASYLIELEFAG